MEEREAHQYFAIQTFNAAWELIEKPDRNTDDDLLMLEAAMASRWHWGFVGGAEQTATGDWQIAHVACLIHRPDLAMMYATRALTTCEREGWTDWRRASMLEGMARACAELGASKQHAKYYALATEAVAAIETEEERSVIASQLATVPKP